MHRVVGDRTRALVGTLTVAGLCRDLTGFATKRLEVPRYHGDQPQGSSMDGAGRDEERAPPRKATPHQHVPISLG
jgi:hypothetical protein